MRWLLASLGPAVAVYLGFAFLCLRPRCGGDSLRNPVTVLVVSMVVVAAGACVMAYAGTL